MLTSRKSQSLILYSLLAVVSMMFNVPTRAEVSNPENCEPEGSAQFLCGIYNVEKLIPVDGSRWAIGSASGGGPNKIPPMYFLNLDTENFYPLDPSSITVEHDAQQYPNCSKPDFATMNSAGMDVKIIDDVKRFYVVNHGGRMTTEVFDIDTSGSSLPKLTWKGCITPPKDNWFMDDLALFGDGSMIITSFFDTKDPEFVHKLSNGIPHGELGIWSPVTGWELIPTGDVSGPNGIILSSDEKTVFFADWGGNGLVKMDLQTHKMTRIKLGFQVDNILWSQNESYILAGGQNGPVADAFVCLEAANKANCDIPFSLVAVDPHTLDTKKLHGPAMIGVVGTGTGAMQDGKSLWLTAFRSDRLVKMPYTLEK